jgi:ribonuclease P protein component
MEANGGLFRVMPSESPSIHDGGNINTTSILYRRAGIKASSFLKGFTREERINQPQDFRRVMKFGKRLQSKNFIFFFQENRAGFHRFGMVIKKEIGPATYRNRIKRYLREFFRLHKHQIRGSLDIVIMSKKGCALNRYGEAEEELRGFFTK